jgi:phosphatidylglycerol---prolipoprotein diacylglyceryl transferase
VTIPYPHISPVAVQVGPLAIRWYGLMYAVGYVVGYGIMRRRSARGLVPLTERDCDTLLGYLMIGMLVGARLVYGVVYAPGHYLDDPLEWLRIWHGGLSFHGGVIGMVVAIAIFGHRHRVSFWQLADTVALAGTPGLAFGRLGNFINGELYGRVTTVPWAMVFPADPTRSARHPSMLYEAVAEGVVLFLLLRMLERRALAGGWYRPGLLTAAFLGGYGLLRFLVELTRQPDPQLGLVAGPFTMGQVLCTVMLIAGVAVAVAIRRAPAWNGAVPEARGLQGR